MSSLSARRAWIEITAALPSIAGYFVALRKESVDRNEEQMEEEFIPEEVALRKESVDRNLLGRFLPFVWFGRSPQGERG